MQTLELTYALIYVTNHIICFSFSLPPSSLAPLFLPPSFFFTHTHTYMGKIYLL